MPMRKIVQHELRFEENCYALLQTDKIHPIAYNRYDLHWYPERGLPLIKQIKYKPYVKSIVTESPWLISCYPQENVWIWKDRDWRNPFEQTYGASINSITMNVLGISQTIPAVALDGGDEINKLIKRINKGYK